MTDYPYEYTKRVYKNIPFTYIARKSRYYDLRDTISSDGYVAVLGTFRSYSGLDMEALQYTGSLETVEVTGGQLPDYTYTNGVFGCLATTGQTYNVLKSAYNNYTTVGSPTIDTTTGYVTGFSGSNYLTLTSAFPASGTYKMIFNFKYKTTTTGYEQTLFCRADNINKCFYVDNGTNKFSLWDGSNNYACTNALTAGNNYWIGVEFNSSTLSLKVYQLADDGTYTLKTLPAFSSNVWSEEINTIAGSDMFSGYTFEIGDNSDTHHYWCGDVDLSGWKITSGNNLVWSPIGSTAGTAVGLLPSGVTDDGSAQTWNLFYNGSTFLLNTTATMTGYTWCGAITIPAHTV